MLSADMNSWTPVEIDSKFFTRATFVEFRTPVGIRDSIPHHGVWNSMKCKQ